MKVDWKKLLRATLKSNWLFPGIVLFFILSASFAGISGSSIGVYNGGLNDKPPRESGIVRFEPQIIRSDEWLVMSQMVISQSSQGFPVINQTIGEGQDMAVVLDVPYKEWSIIFKPQNLLFLVAPLDFAFAFKWWFLAGALAVSAYFFVLTLLPRRRGIAVLIGLIAILSPLLQWWYQSITIMPLVYSFLLLIIFLHLRKVTLSKTQRLWLLLATTYCMTAFIFTMYPPFLIGTFLVVLALYLGIFFKDWRKKELRKHTIQNILGLGICGLTSIGILGLFYLQHHDAIQTFMHTAYPGNRSFDAGNFPFWHFNAPYLGIFQQNLETAGHYTAYREASNQSTSSNFLIPVIPLMILGTGLVISRWKEKWQLAPMIGVLVVLTLFLAHLFIPFLEPLYKLLALHQVAHTRLLLGVGLANILLLCLIIAELLRRPLQLPWRVLLPSGVALTAYYTLVTVIVSKDNPGFIDNVFLASLLTGGVILFLLLLLKDKIKPSLVVLLLVSFFSVNYVHPLNRSLDEVTQTPLAATIHQIHTSDPAARWATDTNTLENYPQANGAKSLSGTYNYPQLALWRTIDPAGKNERLYNRYAHINFKFEENQNMPSFKLLAKDALQITISPCDQFFDKYNVKYIFSLGEHSSKCLKPYKVFSYPSNSLFIYQRVSPQ